MRIGILGGTFNPVHNGHIRLAEFSGKKLKLDKIIFIPVNIPPHKKGSDIIDPLFRYDMVRLAIEGMPNFEASDIEVRKDGTSYSVETLKVLKEKFGPEAELYFITGADSLYELAEWKDVDEIFALARFVVANRPGFTVAKVPEGIETIEVPEMDISSSEIRAKIRNGATVKGIVPDKVISYIEEKGLYKN